MPEIAAVDDPAGAWSARRARLADLHAWTASGRLALAAPGDSATVSVRWAQTGEAYRLRLSAALGQGLVEIEGEPGVVSMRTADDRTVVAESAETLLAQESGWHIPVGGLRYWVLGLADPRVPVSRLELDAAGRPAELDQSGWRVRYLRYERVGDLDLPTKLFAESDGGLSARLVVGTWEVTD